MDDLLKAAAAVVFFSLTSLAYGATNFAGTWTFDPGRSKNIGVMAQMEMTTVIEQTTTELIQKVEATMMGQNVKQELHFDLSGKPMTNDTPMSEKSQTVTKWDGGKLVTTWTTPGAVAGSSSVSVETRYLTEDGKVMIVESSRSSKPPVVMAYVKK